jgi:hypothetical protein
VTAAEGRRNRRPGPGGSAPPVVRSDGAGEGRGPDAPEGAASDILRGCVERYNDLDDGYIGTIEREELCDLLDQVGELCGLDSGEGWVDEWRDW